MFLHETRKVYSASCRMILCTYCVSPIRDIKVYDCQHTLTTVKCCWDNNNIDEEHSLEKDFTLFSIFCCLTHVKVLEI